MGNDISGLPLVKQIRTLEGRVKGKEGLLKRIKEDPKSVQLIANPEDEKRLTQGLLKDQYDLYAAQLKLRIAKAMIEPKLSELETFDLMESIGKNKPTDATAPKVAKEVKDNKKTAQK